MFKLRKENPVTAVSAKSVFSIYTFNSAFSLNLKEMSAFYVSIFFSWPSRSYVCVCDTFKDSEKVILSVVLEVWKEKKNKWLENSLHFLIVSHVWKISLVNVSKEEFIFKRDLAK